MSGKQSMVRQKAAERTRARILDASVRVFSTRTYAEAHLREIAALAGINVALVSRHFGSKEQLLEECLLLTLHEKRLWVEGGPNFGRELAHHLLDELEGANPLPILVLASADPLGRAKVLTLLEEQLFRPLAARFSGDDSNGRAERVLAVCAGLFTWRTLLPRPNFLGSLSPKTRRWFEAALQAAYES